MKKQCTWFVVLSGIACFAMDYYDPHKHSKVANALETWHRKSSYTIEKHFGSYQKALAHAQALEQLYRSQGKYYKAQAAKNHAEYMQRKLGLVVVSAVQRVDLETVYDAVQESKKAHTKIKDVDDSSEKGWDRVGDICAILFCCCFNVFNECDDVE